MILVIACWLATGAIIGTYFYSALSQVQRPFHLANAVGCVPLVIAQSLAGIYPAATLSLMFGLAGLVGLISTRKATR